MNRFYRSRLVCDLHASVEVGEEGLADVARVGLEHLVQDGAHQHRLILAVVEQVALRGRRRRRPNGNTITG